VDVMDIAEYIKSMTDEERAALAKHWKDSHRAMYGEKVSDDDKEKTLVWLKLACGNGYRVDTSSQRFVTHVYKWQGKYYHVTYFDSREDYEIAIKDSES
jgi:hypothetical protein